MTAEDTSQPISTPNPEPAPMETPSTIPQSESVPNEPTASAPAESQMAQVPASEPLPPEPELTSSQSPVSTVEHSRRDLLIKARATIQARKRKKLDKILEALDGKGPVTLKLRDVDKITNDEVEKLLRVSDATATRYLSELEKQGKIRQIGKTGKAVEYTKV